MQAPDIITLLRADRWTLNLAQVVQRALSEPEALQQVLDLVREGFWPAVLTSQKLEARHGPAVMQARLEALGAGRGDYRLVRLLRRFIEEPTVRVAVHRCMESAQGALLMECAAALQVADAPGVLEAVQAALTHQPQGMGSALRALEVMTQPGALRDTLRAWIEAHPGDERLPAVAEALCRAGEPQVPQPVLQMAAQARAQEQFHGFFTGVPEMDLIREQPAAARAHRAFTARRLAEHVAQLAQDDLRDCSLWPEDLEPEPHPASWEYLHQMVAPHLEAAGLSAWYEAALLAHLGRPHPHDHRLFLGALGCALMRQDHARAYEGLRQALAAEAFEAPTQARLQNALRRSTLVLAEAHLTNKDLGPARELADALLADQPSGEALLLDARLTAQELGPEGALACVQAYLPRVGNDPVHHGRLLAEAARAELSLGRPQQALERLVQAVQLEHGEPETLSLLARAHFDLGHEEAQRWAALAIEAGAPIEPLQDILLKGSN